VDGAGVGGTTGAGTLDVGLTDVEAFGPIALLVDPPTEVVGLVVEDSGAVVGLVADDSGAEAFGTSAVVAVEVGSCDPRLLGEAVVSVVSVVVVGDSVAVVGASVVVAGASVVVVGVSVVVACGVVSEEAGCAVTAGAAVVVVAFFPPVHRPPS
jgi:hypothetical protein